MKPSKRKEQLRTKFKVETGINYINSQGEPDIDYILWLEAKVLAQEHSQCDTGDFRDPGNFESQSEYFGH